MRYQPPFPSLAIGGTLAALSLAIGAPVARDAAPSAPGPLFSVTKVLTGDAPAAIVVHDFNGDGLQDVVAANGGGSDLTFALGLGNRQFRAPRLLPATTSPTDVDVSDVDVDGLADLVVVGAGELAFSRSRGDGSFEDPRITLIGGSPSALQTGDFDQDGFPDVAVADPSADSVMIHVGDGSGNFRLATTLPTGSSPEALLATHVDGDSVLDLAVVNAGSDTVSVWIGLGNGSFVALPALGVGSQPVDIAAGDLNSDGALDLAVANFQSHEVSVLIGLGDGSFQPEFRVPVELRPTVIAIEDVDRDGNLDLAVLTNFAGRLSSYLSDGAPMSAASFTLASQTYAGLDPADAAFEDLDRDGHVDAVIATEQMDDLTILGGLGDGGFETPESLFFGTPYPTDKLMTGDFDGDGFLDLIGMGQNHLVIWLGLNDGSFVYSLFLSAGYGASTDCAAADFDLDGIDEPLMRTDSSAVVWPNITGDSPIVTQGPFTGVEALELGDLDEDGFLDAITCGGDGYNAGQVNVQCGSPDLSFGAPTSTAVGLRPDDAAIADFNGDGHLDVVLTDRPLPFFGPEGLWSLVGSGDGSLTVVGPFRTAPAPRTIEVADLDSDGNLDLAIACGGLNGPTTLCLLQGFGDGRFGPPRTLRTHGVPESPTAADFDLDGHLDLVVSNTFRDSITIWFGNGHGFGRSETYGIGGSLAEALVVDDFDADGRPDIAVGSIGNEGLMILLNQGG